MVHSVNTSGALQVVLMKRALFILLLIAPVSLGALLEVVFPCLWARTSYFRESGITQWDTRTLVFWPNGDPLWDGQGCGPTSSCCTFNSPPWFNVQLSSPTTDDIEMINQLEMKILQYSS